jgi:SAM-dependent methyltransferase
VYVEHLFNELEQKPFDRDILDRFAEPVGEQGLVADLGCGPGHVAKYLHERGVDVWGIDLSPEMIRCAVQLCPGIKFHIGDIKSLDFAAESFAGIVSFYSIVHFEPSELEMIFREWRRVLKPDGSMLLAFHIGEDTIHVDDLFGAPVNLDFRFHNPGDVIRALRAADLVVTESIEREPYADVEYPSRRCYVLATAA